MNINYLIVMELDGDIIHQVGYENEPTEADFDSLWHELLFDYEFSLPAHVLKRAKFRRGTQEEVERMREIAKDLE
jgi:hypothetical protein